MHISIITCIYSTLFTRPQGACTAPVGLWQRCNVVIVLHELWHSKRGKWNSQIQQELAECESVTWKCIVQMCLPFLILQRNIASSFSNVFLLYYDSCGRNWTEGCWNIWVAIPPQTVALVDKWLEWSSINGTSTGLISTAAIWSNQSINEPACSF